MAMHDRLHRHVGVVVRVVLVMVVVVSRIVVVVRLSVRLVIHDAVCGDAARDVAVCGVAAFMVMTMAVGMARELRGAENQGGINLAPGDRQQGCALAQAAFQPLARWLQQWLAENQSDMVQFQAQIDDIAAQVLQANG